MGSPLEITAVLCDWVRRQPFLQICPWESRKVGILSFFTKLLPTAQDRQLSLRRPPEGTVAGPSSYPAVLTGLWRHVHIKISHLGSIEPGYTKAIVCPSGSLATSSTSVCYQMPPRLSTLSTLSTLSSYLWEFPPCYYLQTCRFRLFRLIVNDVFHHTSSLTHSLYNPAPRSYTDPPCC